MTNRISRRFMAGAAAIGATAMGVAAIPTAAHADGTESTFDRVTRTKTLRITALPGEAPYYY